MSAAHAVITPPELTVDLVGSLQSHWGIPNPAQIPETPQELFLGDIWASSEPEDETDKVKVAGPASSSPGPWLSESIIDCLLSPEREELTEAEQSRYERLRGAQESFRGCRHDNDTAPAPFLGENLNVFNLYQLKGVGSVKEKRGRKAKNTDAIPAFTRVSDKELDDAYSAWAALPTPESQAAFYEALHGFVQERFRQSKVAAQLVKADEIEDATSDFMIEIMSTLQRMSDRREKLRQPCCHYVSRSMNWNRKGAVVDLSERKKTFDYDSDIGFEGRGGYDAEDEAGSNRATDRVMKEGFAYVQCDSSPDDEFKEDVLDERKIWLRRQIESSSLPTELRALATLYYLEEKTQEECGEELGWVQGTVSKKLGIVREYITKKKAAK